MLDDEALNMLRDLGAAFMSVREAAMILQVNPDALKQCVEREDSPEHLAYHGGRLQSEFEVRQQVIQSAKQSSSPAQVLALKLIDEMKMSNA